MANYIIWMDSEKAHIFNLKPTGIERSNLEKKGADHHTHDKSNQLTDSNGEHFCKELSHKIKDAAEILLMGPGLGKTHFKNYLEKHHQADLAKKIIGVENCDHPTDKQILAIGRKFFQKYDLFNE